jgi:hypothetical protein
VPLNQSRGNGSVIEARRLSVLCAAVDADRADFDVLIAVATWDELGARHWGLVAHERFHVVELEVCVGAKRV